MHKQVLKVVHNKVPVSKVVLTLDKEILRIIANRAIMFRMLILRKLNNFDN